jgi:hypothetical protein
MKESIQIWPKLGLLKPYKVIIATGEDLTLTIIGLRLSEEEIYK